ncbi:MAG: serine/threonine protein kinase, partial [Pirellulales bacterium]|nr:serine/threonine protein kinase [Pirellulales bacterium]
MTLPATQIPRTIAGYTLLERIGAGGYGEVWKAEAPGGLTKAIKLVYGFLGDDRADSEQKSLQRIKDVHHPFLLSLERIEVIDGQLVIVTELAESSIKDRFEECRQEGMPGIPHEELIGYLSDTADALDYICKHYSLQHLDIKPENLLLLGGHAKVGDFGLVKQVEDKTISLMGGLTPVYASPEIFDGRPSLHSDQYSLAIVYQEMLTSALPFPGRTPAQLAVQHASAEPRLGPLPAAAQATIARALAKNPEQRFPNCRAMVDSLIAARQSDIHKKHSSTPADVPTNAPAHADNVTAPVDLDGIKPKPPIAATVATVALERGTTDPPP